jgi:hypothetical protein
MIETIENLILEKLKSDFENFTVESFPADFQTYDFTSAIGCLLVKYDGSDFEKPKSLSTVVQERNVLFTVVIGLRQLNKYADSYYYLEKVRNKLTGLNFWGKKLYPVKDRFLADTGNGDIYLGQQYRIKCETTED